ncbi:MAG: hypothetical protein V1903_03935 [Bacteroidota bacterium]
MMSGLFTIPIGGLKEGQHYFEYTIDKAFFDQFEDPEMLKRLKEHAIGDDNESDPRWDELKKLMNNNLKREANAKSKT